jgi:Response regulator of the LytR/AlgR family
MKKEYVFIKKKDQHLKVLLSDILWVKAMGSSVSIIATNNRKFLLSINLKSFIQKVPAPYFLRIHRSYLINLHEVDAINGRRLMIAGKLIPFSEQYKRLIATQFPILRT